MRNTLLRLAALSCALWFGLEVCAQEARTLTPMDVHRLRSVIGVYPIPDGHHVAFTRLEPRHPDEDPGGARVHLYWVDLRTGEERLLIGGQQSVGGVAVSPDAKYLSFVGRRDDAPHAEVYGLPLDGGEPIRLTTTPHGVSSYAWRPDGKSIAFTRTRAAPAERASAQRAGFSPVIVDEQWNPIDLFLYDRATKTIRTLDEGRAVHGIRWSPDGRRLVAGIAPRNLIDDTYMATRLFEIAVDGAPQDHGLSVDNPGKLGDFAISPNGLMLAYVSASDRRDPHAGMLFLRSAVDGSERCLTTDFEGMVHDLHWWSDTMIHATISVGLKTYVTSIKVSDGTMTQLAGGRGLAFHGFATMPQEPELVFVNGSTAQHPDELFSLTITSGTAPRRWTRSNPWLNEVQLGKQTNEVITARDGLAIEGLLIHPVGYEAKTRYPLVIVAHGGPESHFSEGWLTRYSEWGQMLAGRGYFAWYPNYRSSTGRGVAFAKKDHGDPMGAEFEDHLDAIAAFAERGLIDLDRVGLGGGSYGGYTAAWAATRHSKHFAAAVSFVPFVDIRTKWLTTDIPNEFFHVHYEETWPHEQVDFLAQRSPLTWAPNCRTPLLLLGGDQDPRVHPSQPFMLYRAVKTATETPVRYVQYPGEGHGNRVDRNRYDYALRCLRWFDHYLRPGDHRQDAPPPPDLDYSDWK